MRFRPRVVIALTLYSRPGCHLCDQMKTTIDRVAQSIAVTIQVVDISSDADLDARYGLEVPVLVIDGRKAAKYRVSEEDLRRILIGRAGEAGRAGESGRSGGTGRGE